MKKIVSLILAAALAISASFVSVPFSNVEAATKAKPQKTVKLVTESYNPSTKAATTYTYYKNGLLKTSREEREAPPIFYFGDLKYGGGNKETQPPVIFKEYYYNTYGAAKGQLKKVITTQTISQEEFEGSSSAVFSHSTQTTTTYTITSTDTYKYNKSKLKQIKTVTRIPTYPDVKWDKYEGHMGPSGWEYYHYSNDNPENDYLFTTSDPNYTNGFILSYDWNTDKYTCIRKTDTYDYYDYFGIKPPKKDNYKKVTTIKKFSYKTPTQLTVKSKTICNKYKAEAIPSFERQYGADGHSYTNILTNNKIEKRVFRLFNNHSNAEYSFNKKGFLIKRNYDAFDEFDPTFSSSYSYRYDKNNQVKKISLSTYTGFDYFSEGYNYLRDLGIDREEPTYEVIGGDYYLNYISNDASYDNSYDIQKKQLTAKQIRLSSTKIKKTKVSSFYSQKVKDQQYKLLNQVNTINTFGL